MEETPGEGDPTPGEVRKGQIVVATCGLLSMLGAFAIIVSFCGSSWKSWDVDPTRATLRQKIRALAQGYLLQLAWLSVSNFWEGFFYFVSFWIPRDFEQDTLCKVQSVGRSE